MGSGWAQRLLGDPPAWSGHAAVWDAAQNRMLVYNGARNELWTYQATSNTWAQLAPSGAPPTRGSRFAAAWDPLGSRLLVFGGQHDIQSLNDLWAYEVANNRWVQLTPSGSPPSPREYAEGVWTRPLAACSSSAATIARGS